MIRSDIHTKRKSGLELNVGNSCFEIGFTCEINLKSGN